MIAGTKGTWALHLYQVQKQISEDAFDPARCLCQQYLRSLIQYC